MIKKCILLTCVAIFVLHGSTETEAAPEDLRNIRGIVWDLIQKLNTVVKKAIDDAINKIENIRQGIKDLVFGILGTAQRHIQAFVDHIFDHFQKLKDSAMAFGVDVSDCIDDSENDIKLIAGQIFFDTTTCVTKKMFSAFTILDESLSAIKDVVKDVTVLENEFEACTNSACYIKMSIKVTGFLASLPLRIAKLSLGAQKTIIKIQLEITICEGEKFSDLKTLLLPAIEKVNLCIANKIKGIDEDGQNEENKLFVN